MNDSNYITLPQLAKLMGITRIAVYKKVKKGQIKAERIGRNFAVSKDTIKDLCIKKKTLGEPR
ncbi:MAG: excisionase family DNA-binding protein [Candidatus Omnitrophica bacterium]|nr:excisionase family DNA-binding protein [Candidatus Omnitrophota bacterium]MCM8827206.1 excisionase family DNA-binding protein [Candidatus Omnitrophota bacterium]